MTATITRSVRSGFTPASAQSGHGHLGQSRAGLLPRTPDLLGAAAGATSSVGGNRQRTVSSRASSELQSAHDLRCPML